MKKSAGLLSSVAGNQKAWKKLGGEEKGGGALLLTWLHKQCMFQLFNLETPIHLGFF